MTAAVPRVRGRHADRDRATRATAVSRATLDGAPLPGVVAVLAVLSTVVGAARRTTTRTHPEETR